jgi:hypothetical protein
MPENYPEENIQHRKCTFLSHVGAMCHTHLILLSSSSSYLVTRTNHKASPYATSFSLVLLPLSPVKIFSAAYCSPTPYNLYSFLNIKNQV